MCNGDRVSAGDDDKVLKPAVTAAQHADVPDAAEPCSGGWPQRQPLRSVHFAEVTKRTVMEPRPRARMEERRLRCALRRVGADLLVRRRRAYGKRRS